MEVSSSLSGIAALLLGGGALEVPLYTLAILFSDRRRRVECKRVVVGVKGEHFLPRPNVCFKLYRAIVAHVTGVYSQAH